MQAQKPKVKGRGAFCYKQPFVRNLQEPPTPGILSKVLPVQWGRTAVQIGSVPQYKLEMYCCISLSSRLRSQQDTALQMGGVRRYRLEVATPCCSFYEINFCQKSLLHKEPRKGGF